MGQIRSIIVDAQLPNGDFVHIIVGPLGCFFNIISFIILRDREFIGAQYDYLKVYTLNSAQVYLLSLFFIFVNTAQFIPWSNSYITRAYTLFVYLPFANTGYFYGTFLDIVITLDRTNRAKFLPRVGLQGLDCRFRHLLGD
jgi:hypothetical protein